LGKTGVLLMCVFVMATSLKADSPADGKWEAKIKTQVGEQTIKLNFKSDGDTLTGTVSDGRSGETAIQEGKIDGMTISFKQTVDAGASNISFTYTGKISGDQIAFTREPFKLEFVARRAK